MAINNYEQVAREVLKGANPVTGANGRFYIDGTQTGVIVSKAIADAIYVGEIFRDGMGCTAKYTTGAKPLDSVRVPLVTPFPSSSRTIGIGSKSGDKSAINKNAPFLPSDDEFVITLNQVNDQAILFPDLSKEAMEYNVVATRLAGYAGSVVEDRNASMLAEVLAYNIYRALNNSGANLKVIADLTADNAIANALNDLQTSLDDGDSITGAHTYPTQGRVIIGRPGFINKLFNKNSGVILNGNDLAQTMLKELKFDESIEDRNYVGNAYKGHALGFDFQEANSHIWHLAEKYLGLTQGSLDHIYAIACSSEANAYCENFDFGVKIIDANEVRGSKAQPLNCWGHEAFRLSYLVGDSSLTTSALQGLGFSADERKYPVHPSELSDVDKVTVPVYDEDGKIIGYKEVANVPKPHGGTVAPVACLCTLTTKVGTSATTLSSLPTVKIGNTNIVVTKKADTTGIYTFSIPYGQGADVSCTHTSGGTSYSGTATITNAQATAGSYELTVTLAS